MKLLNMCVMITSKQLRSARKQNGWLCFCFTKNPAFCRLKIAIFVKKHHVRQNHYFLYKNRYKISRVYRLNSYHNAIRTFFCSASQLAENSLQFSPRVCFNFRFLLLINFWFLKFDCVCAARKILKAVQKKKWKSFGRRSDVKIFYRNTFRNRDFFQNLNRCRHVSQNRHTGRKSR